MYSFSFCLYFFCRSEPDIPIFVLASKLEEKVVIVILRFLILIALPNDKAYMMNSKDILKSTVKSFTVIFWDWLNSAIIDTPFIKGLCNHCLRESRKSTEAFILQLMRSAYAR